MKKIIYTQNNQQVYLEVPPPANMPSFFVFALHKSGSVMQDNVFEELCANLKIPMISVAKTSFNQGVEESAFDKRICEIFTQVGYCFYGSRYLPPYLKELDLSGFKKFLLMRDPRDILVSHYFSLKKSHAIPQGDVGDKLLAKRRQLQEITIDDFALEEAPKLGWRIKNYAKIADENLKVFRYEDVVFDKVQWIKEILAFLGLNLELSKIQEIAKRHDVFPETENPAAHIRKVTPGDYQAKLKPSTIVKLNECLEDVLVKYNYEISGKGILEKCPIAIYQMGKVGSQTIWRSLGMDNFVTQNSQDLPIYHVHVLGAKNIEIAINNRTEKNLPLTVQLKHGKELRAYLDTQENPHLKVITVVREPISQCISSVFQTMKVYFPNLINSDGTCKVKETQKYLTNVVVNEKLKASNWFEHEFKQGLGIDVYHHQFNPENGYGIIQEKKLEILILTLENSQIWSQVIADFLHLPNQLKIIKQNTSESKDYGTVYNQIITQLKFPVPVLEKIYSSQYCQHFYTPEMIESFISKWAISST
ncbi:MAG: sulfotransferase domain-containing protein [Gomphosphaeria aponina SAG 52.96 = DSM 107014]|uniref:Sulfotransferase domain-containing protein n=1 Tax=Gomphosphaeria aponina SAG 52.96 = DSM 107014 TaxID=1521640 RepID=A0A941GPF5_9CHRO|nr:sulfotransferase domain-containing protein [Gomphosphaeria aponina SAG 52.96 = DSM 107014]